MDHETIISPRNGPLSPTTIMTSSEDHMLSDRRTMMLKRAHQHSEGSGRGEDGKNLRKRMHIEEDGLDNLHSETTDSTFSAAMPVDKPTMASDNSNIFQKFAGTHPGYTQQYDLMDDLAQQIEPVQHNNIEFENLDDDEFQSNDNALFDFAQLDDDNLASGDMGDDMFLHDPELMVWDEALLLNDSLMTNTPPVNNNFAGNNLAEHAMSIDGNFSQKSNKNNTDNSQKSTPSLTSVVTGTSSSSQSKPSSGSHNNNTKNTPKSKRKNAASAYNTNNSNMDNNNLSNRGNYRCGRCGLPKVNHVCQFVDAVGTTVGIQVATPILQPNTLTPFAGEKFLSVSGTRKPVNTTTEDSSSNTVNSNTPSLQPPMDVDDTSSVLSFGPPPADASPMNTATTETDSNSSSHDSKGEDSESAIIDTFIANRATYLQQQQQIHAPPNIETENAHNSDSNNHAEKRFASLLCSVNTDQTSSTCFFCFS